MKKYISGILILLSSMLPALTSCSDGLAPEPPAVELESDCFNLVVKVPMEAGSRALPTPVELNEFKVRTVHFYFYASEGHDDATSRSIYDCVVTEEFDTQHTLRVGLPENALKAGGIFGTSGTTCIVYAVANVELPQGTARTINELKATIISSPFDRTIKQDDFAMDSKATTVSLDRSKRIATGEIELTRAAAKLTLSLDIPSSITVTNTIINVDGTTSYETHEYHSNTDNMRVWIGNGVKNSRLNTEPVVAAKDDLYSNTIESGSGMEFTLDEDMEKYKYIQNVPFYSYPNKWDATNPDGNTHLTLLVPWWYFDNNGNRQAITSYYRLAVQPKECGIERNIHYDMRVTIGRLGSTDIQKPIDMELEWNYAIPWNTQTLETNIQGIRYLLLNSNYYDSSIENPDKSKGAYSFDMNNTTDIEITFGTSHEVEIESVNMLWHDFLNDTNCNEKLKTNGQYKYTTIDNYDPETIYAGIEVDNTNSKLKFKRNLLYVGYGEYVWVEGYWQKREEGTGSEDKIWIEAHEEWKTGTTLSITKNAAINAYTFDIVLRHIDDNSRKAYVRITQYPGVCLTSQATPDGTRFINDNFTKDFVDQDTKSYAYISSLRPEAGKITDIRKWDYYLGDIYDRTNYVKNINTYIINLTRLDSGDEEGDYIVADPRARSINNYPMIGSDISEQSPATWSRDAASVDNSGERGLKYYYPTDNSGNKAHYIAPTLRIASQWGMSRDITFEGAKRRCASYQENGRPAGRWRLPTVAEIEYIARLSSKGFIPYLFGSPSNKPGTYFCGSGSVTVDNRPDKPTVTPAENLSENKTGNIRCVYDEWYWGEADTLKDKTTFTWGDRARSISRR